MLATVILFDALVGGALLLFRFIPFVVMLPNYDTVFACRLCSCLALRLRP